MILRLLLIGWGISMLLNVLWIHLPLPQTLTAIGGISALVAFEELYALAKTRSLWARTFLIFPEDPVQPTTVVEGDRTFVEVLAAVSGGIIGIGLAGNALSNAWPAKISLFVSLLATFIFLSLQGASIADDFDDHDKHRVRIGSTDLVPLLLLRTAVYWSFLYGLLYIVLAAH